MITDEEIRAAFDRVVALAPDPARIRAGFASRARAHRQRRALLVASGAVAAAGAFGVPAALAWRDRTPAIGEAPFGPDGRTTPNLGPAVAEPIPNAAVERVAMRYRPTWLPEGFVETSRTAYAPANSWNPRLRTSNYQVSEWMRAEDSAVAPDTPGHAPPYIRLVLARGSRLDIADWRPRVRVNGAEGGVSLQDAHVPQVVWQAEDGFRLAVYVSGVPDGRAVAVRIARSVKPDGVAGVECPLRFGWLPDFLSENHEQQLKLSQSSGAWRATRSILVAGTYEAVTVSYGPAIAPPPAGVQATVRGRPGLARTYWGDAGGWAHVSLDGGLDLLVTAGLKTDELARIIDKLDIGPQPYRGWIGQH